MCHVAYVRIYRELPDRRSIHRSLLKKCCAKFSAQGQGAKNLSRLPIHPCVLLEFCYGNPTIDFSVASVIAVSPFMWSPPSKSYERLPRRP